jgi:hypothetical protein
MKAEKGGEGADAYVKFVNVEKERKAKEEEEKKAKEEEEQVRLLSHAFALSTFLWADSPSLTQKKEEEKKEKAAKEKKDKVKAAVAEQVKKVEDGK